MPRRRVGNVPIPAPLPLAIALALGIAVCGRPPRALPPDATPFTVDDRASDHITGTIGGPVITTPLGVGAPLDTGLTTVWVWTSEWVEPGDRVEVVGRLRTPRGFLDPGVEDRAALVAARGAEWELTATRVQHLGRDDSFSALAWRSATRLQKRWARRIGGDNARASTTSGATTSDGSSATSDGSSATSGTTTDSDDTAARAALRGIVTGDRGDVPRELDQRWRAVGIYHVLSVSGLHLAVVAGLVFFLLSRLVALMPWGGVTRPARWAAPISIALAIAYTLVTGGQLATVRALIVVIVVLVGKMVDRPVRLVDSLAFAAIVILVWRPQDLFDPSFQLSFVAALTLAMRPSSGELPTSRVRRWVGRALASSAWVALTTAPITALHFHQVAAGGVIGNLVLTPLVELVALPLGVAGVLLGELWRAGGAGLIDAAVWIVARVDQLAALLARAIPVGTVAIASPLVALVLVVLAIGLATRRRWTRADGVAWLALCVVWGFGRATPPRACVRVTFLDVGQGDAAIVETPGGHVWLVDAGGVAGAPTLETASAPGRAITRTLEAYGHDAIDLAIVSHPHPDHYLGLAALDVPVRELWEVDDAASPDPGRIARAGAALPAFSTIRDALAVRGTRTALPHLGVVRTTDGVELTVWAPRWQAAAGGAVVLGADPVRSVNDNSLVVSIAYGGRTILFAGDLEAEGEEALVSAGLPHVDVVKVAHHGSPTSSSWPFVEATRPEVAVVSCGVANAFGFPGDAVLARWRAVGARVQRTDLDGAVTVTLGADGTLQVARFAAP